MRGLALLAVMFAWQASTRATDYLMQGGDLRHSNHALGASSIQGPIRVSWTAQVTGSGYIYSHPLILSDKIVQTFAGSAAAVDRATGAPRWSQTLPAGASVGTYDPARDLIYYLSDHGTLTALRASDGGVAWTYSEGWVAGTHCYGGVVLAQGRLFFSTGGYGFIALDPDTRTVFWRCTLLGNGIQSAAYDQGKLFVASYAGVAVCIDATLGYPLWIEMTFKKYSSAVTVNDDTLFVMVETGRIEARWRSSGDLKWSFQTASFGYSNMAISGHHLIVATDDRVVRALDVDTGDECWEHGTAGNFAQSAPIVVCDTVFISGCAFEFYGLDASSGHIVWTLAHDAGNSFVDWAVADDHLYVTNANGRLFCFAADLPADPADCSEGEDLCLSTPVPTPIPTPSPGPCAMTADPALALWLSADGAMDRDGSGMVERWLDQSAWARNAITDGMFRPQYVASGPGGRPAVYFSGVTTGSGDFMPLMRSQGMIADKNNFTVLAKFYNEAGGAPDHTILSNGPINAYTFGQRGTGYSFTNCEYLAATGTAVAGATAVLTWRSSPVGGRVYLNGVLKDTTLPFSCPFNFDRPYYLGKQGDTGGEPFKGYLFELIIYNRALSDAERDQIERCLMELPPLTATPTTTPTMTATLTATPTDTVTPSDTPVVSATPTVTATASDSPSATENPTSTASPVFSPTPTATISPSPTQVIPPTPVPFPTERLKDCDRPVIERLVVSPNPQMAAADRMVSLKLGCGADEVVIEIFSSSGVLLFKWVDTGKHVERGQWVHEKYPHDVELLNGTYFVRVAVRVGTKIDHASTTFVVLK